MSFLKKAGLFLVSWIFAGINNVVNKVNTMLTDVSYSGKKSVSLKEMMISRYNDFKLFIHKNIYRVMNDDDASAKASIQVDFLKIVAAEIKISFAKKIKQENVQTTIGEVISMQKYLKDIQGLDSHVSYSLDSCSVKQLTESNIAGKSVNKSS